MKSRVTNNQSCREMRRPFSFVPVHISGHTSSAPWPSRSLSLFLYYNKQTFDCACRCKEEQGERPTERNKTSPRNPTASRNTSYSPFPRENVPLVRSSPVQSSPVHGQSSLWSVRSMVSPVPVQSSPWSVQSMFIHLSIQLIQSSSTCHHKYELQNHPLLVIREFQKSPPPSW